MGIPQPILDALAAVQADAEAVVATTATAAQSAAAAKAAIAKEEADAAAVVDANAAEAAALATLQELLVKYYGPDSGKITGIVIEPGPTTTH